MPELKAGHVGTVLGFDFGTKYIGVAVGQAITQAAHAQAVLRARAGVPHWPEVDALCQEWRPVALVVGLPLNMDATEQAITQKARDFAEALRERYQLPVYLVDERLSTLEAKQQLFDQKGFRGLGTDAVNAYAAKLILESWLLRRG